jgi:hypothetical protein
MTTPCPSCAAAEADPLTGRYHSGCQDCAARMLAHGPQHHEAMLAAAFTPAYRSALQAVFGGEWMEGHRLVRAWSKRIEVAGMGGADAA